MQTQRKDTYVGMAGQLLSPFDPHLTTGFRSYPRVEKEQGRYAAASGPQMPGMQ